MNSEAVLAVLPDSKENALSMNEIASAMGMEISSYTAMGRTKRQLSKTLRALIKWGWVDYDVRQNENGNKAWHNIYWKTALAKSV
jgi:predicted transcriptional regulator